MRLFDAESRGVTAKALLRAPATSVAMSDRESIAAIGQADGTVSVAKIPSLEVEYCARVGRRAWRSAAFSPGGRHLALGGSACLLIMEKVEGSGGEWKAAGKASCEPCATIDWSNDGTSIRTCGGGDDVTVRYWKLLQDGVPVPCLQVSFAQVRALGHDPRPSSVSPIELDPTRVVRRRTLAARGRPQTEPN